MKKKDYQVRDKFFYAVPKFFPHWPYPSRLAIGMNFSDFTAIKEAYFKFRVKDKMYQIDRTRAMLFGKRYVMPGGLLPNLIPLEEFKIIAQGLPLPPEYEYDRETNTFYPKGTRKTKPEQIKLL